MWKPFWIKLKNRLEHQNRSVTEALTHSFAGNTYGSNKYVIYSSVLKGMDDSSNISLFHDSTLYFLFMIGSRMTMWHQITDLTLYESLQVKTSMGGSMKLLEVDEKGTRKVQLLYSKDVISMLRVQNIIECHGTDGHNDWIPWNWLTIMYFLC